MAETPAPVLLVGLGNELRGDDGVGIAVIRSLREDRPVGVELRAEGGDPLALVEAWRGRAATVVVDAVRAAAPAGTILHLDAGAGPLPASLAAEASTHATSLAAAVELARELGTLPGRALVLGVAGRRFRQGEGLSAAVAAALPTVAEEARRLAMREATLEGETAATVRGCAARPGTCTPAS
ncbi:MAG TPA: hydrogenase maturation protease [Solirubrobacterales bacterium]|nr:hydrogenase maturation protease [Solirubrobacterales bacterium]